MSRCCQATAEISSARPSTKPDACGPDDIRDAITDQTVAILYLPWREELLPLESVVNLANRFDLPVIVDAAGSCDEPRNLTRFVSAGAALVCFSGITHSNINCFVRNVNQNESCSVTLWNIKPCD